ncbi:DUF4145 domain-containing protein [Aquibacillus rhizosphaerae]|uniref:DUF4145 domain-containing protein n=1 Tax=Aquibacillus rhizosphaerae TaxID=3051431 RepID=A0ABT7LBL1_9BACI|nr:DUF4145 domain-containing protein [Aquibacillus sp. LR5S19]MDL4843249.1 DUF4145 domain-containing protein [Aquibacillus sp. LR5S19]
MNKQTYFYQFLEPVSKELALVARELENSIFTSPRTMLTHARVFIETILGKVVQIEKIPVDQRTHLKERLASLDEHGYLTNEIRDALHHVRMIGNQAAHDSRIFRFSEALLSWEAVYKIVKWYVEVYGPVNLTVPDYQDPSPQMEQSYDIAEVEVRLKALEELLTASVHKLSEETAKPEIAAIEEEIDLPFQPELPGFTTIRKISYKDQQLEVPHFLRDAFLLPQRFSKSEMFLIRLGGEQQARIMSELPKDLENLHKHVKRYNEKNDATLFDELQDYIKEEKTRRKLLLERPGELFLFYKTNYVIVTEQLASIQLNTSEFTGIPSLIRQLNEDQIEMVGQLPKELVILAKYENVGVGTVEKLFDQLKEKQLDKMN